MLSDVYFFIFLCILFLELYAYKFKFIEHCFNFFAYCTLGNVPHSRSLLNVTACTQMQIEAWDCVCNQSCTLIHTSNDEDVSIQLV